MSEIPLQLDFWYSNQHEFNEKPGTVTSSCFHHCNAGVLGRELVSYSEINCRHFTRNIAQSASPSTRLWLHLRGKWKFGYKKISRNSHTGLCHSDSRFSAGSGCEVSVRNHIFYLLGRYLFYYLYDDLATVQPGIKRKWVEWVLVQ